jgi:hypothetical protein
MKKSEQPRDIGGARERSHFFCRQGHGIAGIAKARDEIDIILAFGAMR